MADPEMNQDIGVSPMDGGTPFNLNERLDCENLEEMTDSWTDGQRPSFVTALMRLFGNVFVDMFRAIFS
uniref:Uncharacterized protein LOC108048667 n=1 Tax=Drosophila rhopaloa TaxID=1041015 RepID=A0A6P4FHM1_DRORH